MNTVYTTIQAFCICFICGMLNAGEGQQPWPPSAQVTGTPLVAPQMSPTHITQTPCPTPSSNNTSVTSFSFNPDQEWPPSGPKDAVDIKDNDTVSAYAPSEQVNIIWPPSAAVSKAIEKAATLDACNVILARRGSGVIIRSHAPHLNRVNSDSALTEAVLRLTTSGGSGFVSPLLGSPLSTSTTSSAASSPMPWYGSSSNTDLNTSTSSIDSSTDHECTPSSDDQ